MKNLKSLVLLFVLATAFLSCDNNDELVVDPTSEFDAEILVTEDGVGNKLNASIDIIDKYELQVRVKYTSNDQAMRRLYITVDSFGRGEVPFKLVLGEGEKVDLKGDGSIDLESKYKKGFDFQFDIKAPKTDIEGTVVYKFWTTSGRGDFRDNTKRQKLEVSTITLKYGESKDDTQMKSFTATQLFAPLADGTSKTFISLFDGKTYKINEGSEMAALWDIGFLYENTKKATLYSVENYPLGIFKEDNMVSVIEAIKEAGINKAYFKRTSKDKAFFDNVAAADFSSIEKSDKQSIDNLEVGNVIEFVDNYGKKGYIYVADMKKSLGNDGFITINVKMEA